MVSGITVLKPVKAVAAGHPIPNPVVSSFSGISFSEMFDTTELKRSLDSLRHRLGNAQECL